MAAPDPLAVRVFQGQVARHQAGARSEFANVQRNVESLTNDIEAGNVILALGAAKNIARTVADLISHLSALATLNDVAFLTTDPDTEEK